MVTCIDAMDAQVGYPSPTLFGTSSRMKAFYRELCPPFRKKDVRRMVKRLKETGALDNLKFLKVLHIILYV